MVVNPLRQRTFIATGSEVARCLVLKLIEERIVSSTGALELSSVQRTGGDWRWCYRARAWQRLDASWGKCQVIEFSGHAVARYGHRCPQGI